MSIEKVKMWPSYLNLSQKELERRTERASRLLNPCRVCPRKCGVNRIKDQKNGFCRMGRNPVVSFYYAHHGEENVIRGWYGSGIIFFTSCNLACVFCQNWEISQARIGKEIFARKLAEIMLHLQEIKCHNINLCSPSIWVPQILEALVIAAQEGLKIPLVYNSGGYDSAQTLKLLDGIVDIYMPDIKYSNSTTALKYSFVPKYWEVVKNAVREMYRQVGDLVIENGLGKRGLLIRHLVLPGGLAGTEKVMEFIASLSKNSYVNIMDQYYPTNKADLYPEIKPLRPWKGGVSLRKTVSFLPHSSPSLEGRGILRREINSLQSFFPSGINRQITPEEYQGAVKAARREGIYRFDKA